MSIFKQCLLVLTATLLFACSNVEQLDPIPTGATVLILGDSLSYGTGASKEQSYPTLLAQKTGWNIINAGVPGDTSAKGLARLPELLKSHQPEYLFIELGGNDFLQGIDIQTTENNLRAIIHMSKEYKTTALLIAIPDFKPIKATFIGLDDHPIYQKIATETKTALIEDIFSDVLDDNDFKSDYVHPNQAGYLLIVDKLEEALTKKGFISS